jgi:hypothetical protein
MKHHALVLLSLLFLAVPAAVLAAPGADTVATDPEAPAAEVPDACSAPAGLADLLRPDFAYLSCGASADCLPFSQQSCIGTGTCVGVDRNCTVGERGYVTCNGSTTYCAGPCCAQDGVCEYGYGCGCTDEDCCSLGACQGHPNCPLPPCECSEVTNCQSNRDCCTPGSICTPSGMCLCAG